MSSDGEARAFFACSGKRVPSPVMAERASADGGQGWQPGFTRHLPWVDARASRANWGSEFGDLSRRDKFCHVFGGLAFVTIGQKEQY